MYFLDYYAVGRLDVSIAQEVVRGISDACVEAACSLIGQSCLFVYILFIGLKVRKNVCLEELF